MSSKSRGINKYAELFICRARALFAATPDLTSSFVVFVWVCLALSSSHQSFAATCTTKSYSESFGSSSTNDSTVSSVINWSNGGPVLPTHKQGAFPLSSNNPQRQTFNERIVAADTNAMFLMGGRRNALVGLTTTQGCQLVAYGLTDQSSWSDSPDLDLGSRLLIDSQASCGQAPMVLTGDVAGNGNMDIVTLSPTNIRTTGEINKAFLYVRQANSSSFAKYDISAPLKNAGISVHGGTPAALGDLDGDGTADLLIASSRGDTSKLFVFYANARGSTPGFSNGVELVSDLTLLTPIADAGRPYTPGDNCQGIDSMTSRGATALAFGDIDGDLLPDVIVASQSQYGVTWFRNTGRGSFQTMPYQPCYPDTIRLFLQDMDGDGQADLVGVRNGRGCGYMYGRAWVRFNDGQNSFVINPNGKPGVDLAVVDSSIDWGGLFSMPLVFPDGTQAAGGAPSILIGKASGASVAGNFYNLPASNLYVTQALAVTKPITSPSNGASTLVQIQVNQIKSTTANGGSVTLDVSADNGRHWESLSDAEVQGSQPHLFTHFGQQLRWRATVTSPTAALPDSQASYLLASKSPSKLSNVSFSYTQSTAATYTRSQAAYTPIMLSGKSVDHVLQATFEYPGFIGHLKAQNLAPYGSGSSDSLETLTPGTTWDSASQLSAQSAGSRQIFTMSPQNVTNNGTMTSMTGTRIAFSAAEFSAGSTNPSLATLTQMDPARGPSFINLLRDSTANSDGYKLRDPGHSSPVVVFPPSDDAKYQANNYDTYAQQQNNRATAILMGANDGMLHAFDASTGNESWAYVPSNLLSKMQTQLAPFGDKLVYQHDAFVDGPITVADIFAQNKWRTVAIVGQGEGSTTAGINFYHALDVTDPTKGIPLWEFTEGLTDNVRLCNPDPCNASTWSDDCSPDSPCKQENKANFGQMRIDTSNYNSGALYGMIEAEHFDVNLSSSSPQNPATFTTVVTNSGTRPSTASNSRYVTASGASSSCTSTSFPDVMNCASLGYRLYVDYDTDGMYVPAFSMLNHSGATQLTLAIDDLIVFSGAPSFTASGSGWKWAVLPAQYLAQGDHTFQIFMREPNINIDQIVFIKRSNGPSSSLDETTDQMCQIECVFERRSPKCVQNPDHSEWPACGRGSNQKCCAVNDTGYCTDVDNACGQPPSRMGQTFSTPAVGRIRTSRGDTFVSFFASGYNTFPASINVGRSLYMVNAWTGAPMGTWNLPAVSTTNGNPNIATALPGGVTLVDADDDGYVDRLYVGDLSGRLWKLNTSQTAAVNNQGVMSNPSNYSTCVVFDAAQQGGSRQWAPIITKPAALLLADNTPNIYFGTGGDSRAPSNVAYSFFSVRDTDNMGSCSGTAKTVTSLSSNRLEWIVTESRGNGRFWADPTVVDGTSVIFSSYIGSPDTINPCTSSQQSSHVYGIAAKTFSDSSGRSIKAGATIWSNKSAFLQASGVIRTAASIRGKTTSQQVVRPQTVVSSAPQDLLFQQFTGELLRVASPGVGGPTKRLRVISIREIPR